MPPTPVQDVIVNRARRRRPAVQSDDDNVPRPNMPQRIFVPVPDDGMAYAMPNHFPTPEEPRPVDESRPQTVSQQSAPERHAPSATPQQPPPRPARGQNQGRQSRQRRRPSLAQRAREHLDRRIAYHGERLRDARERGDPVDLDEIAYHEDELRDARQRSDRVYQMLIRRSELAVEQSEVEDRIRQVMLEQSIQDSDLTTADNAGTAGAMTPRSQSSSSRRRQRRRQMARRNVPGA